MARLVVTRPVAGKTIKALESRGHQVTHAPLTKIVPCSHETTISAPIHALIATSRNALKFAAPELLQQLKDKPIYCVGSKTAQMAIELGLTASLEAINCCETAEDLARLIVKEPLYSYAYLCSRHRMSTLDDKIPADCLQIIETYEAPFIEPDLDPSTSVDGVLLYSIRAAQAWSKRRFKARFCFCMSENIAKYLSPEQQKTAIIATKPLEKRLFIEIDKIFSTN